MFLDNKEGGTMKERRKSHYKYHWLALEQSLKGNVLLLEWAINQL